MEQPRPPVNVVVSYTCQEPSQPVQSDEIRVFCALTPYAHTPAICRGTMGRNMSAPALWLQAKVDGVLVGVAMVMIKAGVMAIQHMLVTPGQRNKGIGTRLLGDILKLNTDKMPILLSVRDDARAARFFTSRGFQYCVNEAIIREHFKKPRARDDPSHDTHWGVLATCKLGVEETHAYSIVFNF